MSSKRILIAFAAASLSATPAFALCNTQGGCIDPDPRLPLPAPVIYGGDYRYSDVDGFIDDTYKMKNSIFDPGIQIPINSAAGFGDIHAGGLIQTTISPVTTVSAVAFADGTKVASGVTMSDTFIYEVKITALTAIASATLNNLIVNYADAATFTGNFILSAAGGGSSSAYIVTNANNPLAVSVRTGGDCDSAGNAAGCGTFSYTLPLALTRGDRFHGGDGDIMDFYGSISLNAVTQIGIGASGTASSYIDPVLTLSPDLDPSQFALSFGNGNVSNAAAAVPEPGSWAMLLVGFGVVGASIRTRRKSVIITAG